MPTLTIPYNNDLLITNGQSLKALERELQFLLAVKLFEIQRLSLGKAAEFCQMSKISFMYELVQESRSIQTIRNPIFSKNRIS